MADVLVLARDRSTRVPSSLIRAPLRAGTSALLILAAASTGAIVSGCRDEATPSRAPDAGERSDGGSSGLSLDGGGPQGVGEPGGEQAGLPEPKGDASGGGGAARCEGARLSLFGSLLEPRCEISEREWTSLVQSAGAPDGSARAPRSDAGVGAKAKQGGPDGEGKPSLLRQEAQRDGDDIVVSIVNAGATAIAVPLRYHPSHPELAFSVLAETDAKAVFELAPPQLGADAMPKARDAGAGSLPRPDRREPPQDRWRLLAELDGGSPSVHVYTARIKLPPGGRASARLEIDPTVTKRLDRSCPDPSQPSGSSDKRGGAPAAKVDGGVGEVCLPSRLPRGHVVLYVGQLITGIDAGPPARVEWNAP